MTYKIGSGITEAELAGWLERAVKRSGTFKDGRVDYTKADIAPIVMCIVVCGDEILLAKRGFGLADAEGYWSIVTGFIDEVKPIKEQARQEIKEELGINVDVKNIQVGQSYTLQNSKEKRRYIVFPCLVRLTKKPKIVLDHEHTEFAWIAREELKDYDILDDLPHAIDAAFKV